MTEAVPESVSWLTEPEMKAWRALLEAAYGLLATLDQELQAQHGLSIAEYEVLAYLTERADGQIRMSELAGALHLSPSGMTRRIDGMVKRGFVRREQCPNDRRASYVLLTDEGCARIRDAAPTHVRGVREHFVDRLSGRQLSNLASALSAVKIDPDAASGGCDDR